MFKAIKSLESLDFIAKITLAKKVYRYLTRKFTKASDSFSNLSMKMKSAGVPIC